MESQRILQSLGGYKKYQVLVFLALSFVYMRGAWQVFAILFIGADPGHHCAVDTYPPANESGGVQYHPSGKCQVIVEGPYQNYTKDCPNGYTYGSEFKSTILTEWNLVCEDDYKVDLSSTIYMIGNSLGAVALTPLSDRFGRKWQMLVCLWVQAAIGFSIAFVKSYVLFVVLRFLVGFLNMAIALTAYVMMTEVFTATHRTKPAILFNMSWAVGIISLAAFGYLVRDWRHLELLVSLPNLITVIYCWLLPESIPWLVAKGRMKQVEKIARSAARINKLALPPDLFTSPAQTSGDQNIPLNTVDDTDGNPGSRETIISHDDTCCNCDVGLSPCTIEAEKSGQYQFTIVDLFRTSRMRRFSLITFYLWFVNSLGYFGILFSTPALHGNQFLNLAISGAVEIPALFICMFALDRYGRKKPLIVFLLLCGIMNIATLFVPEKTGSGTDLVPLITTLAMVGKFGITGSYSTIYLMSAELFPTVVRNQAVGLSSFFENIGGIAAPFIVYGAEALQQMPLVLFGVLTIIGGVLAIFLPETHNRPLPETIQEVEEIQHIDKRQVNSGNRADSTAL